MTSAFGKKNFRFAPSPNGYLHLGHAYSALLNHMAAQRSGGRLLLRIEDIDPERCRPEFEAALLEDLHWLGLDFEQPYRRQSAHLADYRAALDALIQSGLAYPCFCSRAEIAASIADRPDWRRDPDGSPLYSGHCRGLSLEERQERHAEGKKFCLRLNMDEALARVGPGLFYCEYGEGEQGATVATEPGLWGDALIGRRDVCASYHIACVLDDAAQGISDIVRGADLQAATDLHRLLQALLSLPIPNYHHHRLVLDENGKKLSKSLFANSLRDLRAKGATPQTLREDLSRMMGRPL